MTRARPRPGSGGAALARGPGAAVASAIGLPGRVQACLFDLDGVLTETAKVHAMAWKEMFDACLRAHACQVGGPFAASGPASDYDACVDGKPRADGTRSLPGSHGIMLPEGGPDDPPGAETVRGLGGWKNRVVLRRIRQDGVQAYDGPVRYVRAVRDAGLRRAMVSSSTNCAGVLAAAGLEALFGERVEGLTVKPNHLAGKPASVMFLAAARAFGAGPADAAVFEDPLTGVAAGRAGGFGFVAGAGQAGHASELQAHGADVVVAGLAELPEES
jgi:HAD superfamily hydrolase (TIGR01509 family)